MIHFDPAGGAWLCAPEHIPQIVERIRLAIDKPLAAVEIGDSEPAAEGAPPYQVTDGRAVVAIHGPIVAGLPPFLYEWLGMVDPVAVEAALLAARDDDQVEKIELDIDSPGGYAGYIPELADTVHGLAEQMPVHAKVTGMAASAAYYVASQARTIKAGQASMVGSIGTYAVMVDSSAAAEEDGIKVHVIASDELKGAGVPGAPVTDAQLAVEAEIVDGITDMFKAAVRRGRGDRVSEDALLGRVWLAQDAIGIGLIDGLAINKLEDQMKIEEMEASLESIRAERDQLMEANTEAGAKYAALLDEHTAQGERLAAAEDKIAKVEADAAEAEARQTAERGDALIAEYQAKGLAHHKLYSGDEDVPTRLCALAYTDPAAFTDFATAALPDASLQVDAVGENASDGGDIDTETRALEMAKAHHNKHGGSFEAAWGKALQAATTGTNMED